MNTCSYRASMSLDLHLEDKLTLSETCRVVSFGATREDLLQKTKPIESHFIFYLIFWSWCPNNLYHLRRMDLWDFAIALISDATAIHDQTTKVRTGKRPSLLSYMRSFCELWGTLWSRWLYCHATLLWFVPKNCRMRRALLNQSDNSFCYLAFVFHFYAI